jgi:ribonuclease BN (tRNA processing enzyme)
MGRICFSLDVLTDGSEFTGHGTLFLSVWRKPKSVDHDDDSWLLEIMKTTPPLARYAISGLGDATSRLCADQRLKLAPTRAVFLPCSNSWDGLSAMLLALHSAGAPSLHVVTTPDLGNRLEELAEIILGRHRGFNIPTCQVPLSSQGEPTWWKVYDDEYLVVHGSCRHDANDPPALILLYTLFEKEDARTFLLIPPSCRDVNTTFENIQKEKLPIHNDIAITVDYVIALDPSILPEANVSENSATIPPFLVTTPNQNKDIQDPGVLIRAQQVAQVFHKGMPWAFPYSSPHSSDLEPLSSRHESGSLVLRSGTSLIVDFKADTLDVLDRRAGIWARDNRQDWSSTLESLTSLIPKGPSVEDENEIDLEDDEGDDDDDEEENGGLKHPLQDPHLIVLGTGCASPSALRGASGYAVVFPKSSVMYPNGIPIDRDQVIILDCGEGVATMLSRHGGSSSDSSVDLLPRIAGIWISHTHLDHYGGLPTLLRAIFETSQQRQQGQGGNQQSESSSRNPKQSRLDYAVPWVMAPAKVLRFLDIVLECHRGRRRQGSSSSRPMFLPRTHDDPTVPPGPWSWFQNIKVYHSCCPCFGILLGWQQQQQQKHGGQHTGRTTNSTSFLCYSGDTRPCRSLVQVCRHALATTRSRHLVLLHEATFQEEEQESAEKKKHATVTEAIQVGRDIPASQTLLSHFSQRYVSLTKIKEMGVDDNNMQSSSDIPVGLAMDGLWLPLTAK